MRILPRSVFLFAALCAVLPWSLSAADEAGWSEDYAASVERAKAEDKPILLLFTGSDWCYYCKVMDKEVFSTAAFNEFADENLILVKADFPRNREVPADVKEQNEKLAGRYGIQGFPTMLVLSAEGKILGKTVGAQLSKPDDFIAMVREASKAS